MSEDSTEASLLAMRKNIIGVYTLLYCKGERERLLFSKKDGMIDHLPDL